LINTLSLVDNSIITGLLSNYKPEITRQRELDDQTR
jgi:hypothetical protein